MWYIILVILGLNYLLINLVLPSNVDSFLGTYILRPLLWIFLSVIVFLIAKYEGLNIWKFNKTKKRGFGEKPIHLALIIGGFQISLLIFIGVFAGFGKSPYSFTPIGIIINLAFVISFLIGIELSRAYLVKKGSKSRKYSTLNIVLVALLFTLIQILPYKLGLLTFAEPIAALEFLAISLITAFSASLLASYLSYLGGASSSIVYMGMLMFFEWFSPILPNPHWIMLAFVGTIVPVLGYMIIQITIQPKQTKKLKKSTKRSTSPQGTIIAIFCVIIVFFSYGYFGVSPTVIYSGSMRPVFDTGDIVLISDVSAEEIKVGDIIQFQNQNMSMPVVHRVYEIYEEGDNTIFITKGDANSDPDRAPVLPNHIMGKVVFNIPKMGWIPITFKNIVKSMGVNF